MRKNMSLKIKPTVWICLTLSVCALLLNRLFVSLLPYASVQNVKSTLIEQVLSYCGLIGGNFLIGFVLGLLARILRRENRRETDTLLFSSGIALMWFTVMVESTAYFTFYFYNKRPLWKAFAMTIYSYNSMAVVIDIDCMGFMCIGFWASQNV